MTSARAGLGSSASRSETASVWPSRFALALSAPLAHAFSEWLFFATKPSFLDGLSNGEKFLVLARVAAWLMSAAAIAAATVWIVARLARSGPLARAAVFCARSLPALVVAATLLLLADNFLYTVTGWGTPRLEGPVRWLGTAAYLGLLALVAPRVARWEAALSRLPWLRFGTLSAAGLVLVVGLVESPRPSERLSRRAASAVAGAAPRWNVVLLGGDGVSASRLASFGGERATTPFLDRLAADSLVAINTLPNADATGASLTSILTSTLPSETRVVYPPDIARGPWIYRHLPGLLRDLGYTTAQISLRWYADSVDLNLQDSFDWANGRRPPSARGGPLRRRLDADGLYFLDVVTERLLERVAPPAVARQSRDAHREIVDESLGVETNDARRIESLREFVASSRRPFFAHVHLMATHDPHLPDDLPRAELRGWRRRARLLGVYDDALLDFDRRVEEVVRILADAGELERTLLVVYSDHGRRWSLLSRVPLLVHAPGGTLRQRIERPAQLLDVAPTVLELLRVPVPEWMRGRSLLDPSLEACPEIFAFGHAKHWSGAQGHKYFARATPPFYSVGSVALSVGRRSVILDLDRREVWPQRLDLVGEGGEGCPELDPRRAAERLLGHLAAHGYDVSTLRERLSFRERPPRPRPPPRPASEKMER